MSRADSTLSGRMIFNVGARRSGTFWLQRIVTAHPHVGAVGSETHLFSHGIAPLAERFHHAALGSGQVGSTFIERGRLLDALREFCDTVFEPMFEPGKPRLAERTPLHALHTGLIADIYPDGRIVHIIRDGRDVVRSLLAQRWGPEDVAEAAQEWRAAVQAARAGAADSNRYLEVRYEDLHADPLNRIAGLYRWLELPVDDAVLERALVEAKVELNLDPAQTPAGAGKWRAAFTPEQLAAFEEVAGDVLDDLGYPRAQAQGSRRRPRLRGRLRRGAADGRRPAVVKRAGRDVEAQQHLDALLDAFHTAPDRAGELLGERATVRIVDGATERAAGGRGARELLVAALRSDAALRGHQVRGDVHPEPPLFTVFLRYETPDGPADRMLVARLEGERVRDLALYRPEVSA